MMRGAGRAASFLQAASEFISAARPRKQAMKEMEMGFLAAKACNGSAFPGTMFTGSHLCRSMRGGSATRGAARAVSPETCLKSQVFTRK